MASIFYDTTGSFSALTPKKVVAGVWTLRTSIGAFTGNATNTARFEGFTASESGDCEGVLLPFQIKTTSPSQTVQISLQQSLGTFTVTIASPAVFSLAGHGMSDGDQVTLATTGALPSGLSTTVKYYVVNKTTDTFQVSLTAGGSAINTTGSQSGTHTLWHDKRLVTKTYDEIIGAEHLAEFTGTSKGTCVFRYIEWSSAYTIDTTASKYRICVYSTDGNCYWSSLASPTSSHGYAVVVSTGASYSANDDIYIKDDITLTVDQTITATSIIQGSNSLIDWDTTPSGSFTLTATTHWFPAMAKVNIGTSTNPIPYAQQAVYNITTVNGVFAWYGGCANEFEAYGEVPAGIVSYVKTQAASGQKVVEIEDDFSALWTTGDSLAIFAGTASAIRYDTVASVSGTSVTMTNNLATTHDVGYAVINLTRSTYYGVRFQKSPTHPANYYYKYNIKGAKFDTSYTYSIGYASSAQYLTDEYMAKITPFSFDSFSSGSSFVISPQSYVLSGTANAYLVNSSISNYVNVSTVGLGNRLSVTYPVKVIFSNIFLGSYVSVFNISGINHTIDNLQSVTTWGASGYYNLNASSGLAATTWTNCKFTSLWMGWSGASNTWTNCTFDGIGGIYPSGSIIGDKFINCKFGDIADNTRDYYPFPYLNQMTFENCTFSTTPVYEAEMSKQIAGSYQKMDTFDQTANDHRSWWVNGKMQSTGDGLTDTTVRTSGTGKFALRFEPLSSTNNLEWDFTVPTGNIQNLTMTVFMWVKINSATYYAGTHQLPRLTINYDNGTTAYAQAAENTDWQLLYVAFTPTTTYGQITVTVSGRTDATSTDAYFYIDDFGISYPPNVALDLGGLDNWASALPVTPPIALPISAGTVAQQVALNVPGEIKYIDGGEIPLY